MPPTKARRRRFVLARGHGVLEKDLSRHQRKLAAPRPPRLCRRSYGCSSAWAKGRTSSRIPQKTRPIPSQRCREIFSRGNSHDADRDQDMHDVDDRERDAERNESQDVKPTGEAQDVANDSDPRPAGAKSRDAQPMGQSGGAGRRNCATRRSNSDAVTRTAPIASCTHG